MHMHLVGLLVATAFLGAPATLGGGQAQEILEKDRWSVYDGDRYYPPSCHQLSYFSGSPLRFDTGGEVAKWKPGSYTVKTYVNLLGTSRGHRIYQVLQDICPRNEELETSGALDKTTGEIEEIGMKRLLVERRPNQFCMIFAEQGTLGPSAEIVDIQPAEFTRIEGEPVLLTHDLVSGNGGYTIDGVWTFDNGVPVSLLTPLNASIARALKEILPPGCGIRPNRNGLDLEHLRFLAGVWPSNERSEEGGCEGTVLFKLGMRNRRLVVVDRQYAR
jgi:hypothetical protein